MTFGNLLPLQDREGTHLALAPSDSEALYASSADAASLWRSLACCASRLASTAAHELDRTLALTLRRLTTVLGADTATLWSFEGQALRQRQAHRSPHDRSRFTPDVASEEQQAWSRLPRLVGTLRAGRAVSLNASAAENMPAMSDEHVALGRDGISALLAVPCVSNGAVVGALSLECESLPRDWSSESVEAVSSAANTCGLVLVREGQHRDLQRLRRRENVGRLMLGRLLSASAGEIDLELERMLRLLGELLDVDRCALFQLSAKAPRLSQTHVWQSQSPRRADERPWLFFCDAVLHWESRRALVFSSPQTLPEGRWVDHEMLEAAGVRSAIAMPLCIGTRVIGGIECTSLRQERQWQTEELELVAHFGELAVTGLMRPQSPDA